MRVYVLLHDSGEECSVYDCFGNFITEAMSDDASQINPSVAASIDGVNEDDVEIVEYVYSVEEIAENEKFLAT